MSQKIALIIGNSEYDDSNLARLVTPGADASDLAAILRDPEVGGFDEVTALVNQSSAAIRRAISSFFSSRSRDDLLLLYFSGHGVRDDRGQLFLAAKDTEHNLLRGTAIPASFITDEMDNSRSRRQVLVLDCCHSGAFSQGMKGVPGASVGTASAFEGTGAGRVVLTATDSTQYAWEGDQVIGQAENSVFTHYLVHGLRSGEADSDGDGRITLDELYDYVYEQVVNETPRQTPSKWSYGQQGEIVIARNPHPVIKKVELPPEIQQAADDPRPWVREGAVQELDRILKGANPGLSQTAYETLKGLADDDSRRVASLAAQRLADYEKTQALKAQPQPRPDSPDQAYPGAKPAIADQPVPEKAAQETPLPKSAAPEPVAQTIAETGLPPVQESILEPETGAAASHSIAEPAKLKTTLPWLQILASAVGWAFAFALGLVITWNNRSPLIGLIPGALAGATIGLVLLNSAPKLMSRLAWIILIAGWGIALMLIWGTDSAVGASLEYNGGSSISPIVGGIFGFFGGLVTGWVLLHRAGSSLKWMNIAIVIIGWAVAGYIGMTFFPSDASSYNKASDLIIPGLLIGAVTGAIGGAVMVWQIRQAQKD